MSDLIDGEVGVIEKYIGSESVVFDVGAFVGEWSLNVLSRNRASRIHCFEPVSFSYEKLKLNLLKFILSGNVIPCCIGISNRLGENTFWVYEDAPALSTKHKRNEQTMIKFGVGKPKAINITCIPIDVYCRCFGVEHVDFLKIDTEGNELAVMKGAENMLSKGRIEYIQFEYGGCFQDAGITLREIFFFLKRYGYRMAKMSSAGLNFLLQFSLELEDYEYCNYLAVRDK